MALSVVDLYQKVLPRTNCGDCGHPTCLAFASMVVSEKLSIADCPHLSQDTVDACTAELAGQYAEGKWTKRDLAADALEWARDRASSMDLKDLPARIGGELVTIDGAPAVSLPYFTGDILIRDGVIEHPDGRPLGRWEQVFIFNHMAQGGSALPGGTWKALQEIPNTVSKIKSMRNGVEAPLVAGFTGRAPALRAALASLGGEPAADVAPGADVAMRLSPLPRVPVLVLFWDADPSEGFPAEAKLNFDATITEHLDIESILFLSERIAQLLTGEDHGH